MPPSLWCVCEYSAAHGSGDGCRSTGAMGEFEDAILSGKAMGLDLANSSSLMEAAILGLRDLKPLSRDGAIKLGLRDLQLFSLDGATRLGLRDLKPLSRDGAARLGLRDRHPPVQPDCAVVVVVCVPNPSGAAQSPNPSPLSSAHGEGAVIAGNRGELLAESRARLGGSRSDFFLVKLCPWSAGASAVAHGEPHGSSILL